MTSPSVHKAFTTYGQYSVSGNATENGSIVADWERTKGGRATLQNPQTAYNRWHLVWKERD